MNNALTDFIQANPNWRTLLTEKPYCLTIKEERPYTLFKYSQIDSDFYNPIVRVSRGIILRITEFPDYPEIQVAAETETKIVCWPFNKFGNYGEGYADSIDWDSARIQEKIDGSIIKVWFDETWHVSTNGMIDAFGTDLMDCGEFKSFGALFDRAWENAGMSRENIGKYLNPNYTYIFELVSPWNRVVVPYKDIKLYFIGARDMLTGEEVDPKEFSFGFGASIAYPTLYKFTTWDEMIATAAALPFSQEGYVVVDKDWHRVKVKSTQYLMCHRMKGEGVFSLKRAYDLVLTGETSEVLSYFPEYTSVVEIASRTYQKVLTYLAEKEVELNSRVFDTRKDFALYIKDWPFKGYFFSRKDNKVSSAKEYLASSKYDELPEIFKEKNI